MGGRQAVEDAVGSLNDENEKNAAARRPATAAKTPLGLGSELVSWSASGFRSICHSRRCLDVRGMGAALGAHRVSTLFAPPQHEKIINKQTFEGTSLFYSLHYNTKHPHARLFLERSTAFYPLVPTAIGRVLD